MTLNERLKQRRLDLGLTLEEVGNYVGVGKSTVRKWETGFIKDMKRSQIAKYAEILKIPPTVILGIEPDDIIEVSLPSAEPVTTINIWDALCCGTGAFVDDNIVGTITLPKSMLPKGKKELFGQYANGESMAGKNIHDGDLLIFSREQCSNGDIGCFCIDENVAMCKILRIVGDQIMLMPANDEFEPIIVDPEKFVCVGKLVLTVNKV